MNSLKESVSFQKLIECLREKTNARNILLGIRDEEEQFVFLMEKVTHPCQKEEIKSEFMRRVFKEQRPLIHNFFSKNKEDFPRNVLCFPLHFGGNFLGAIYLERELRCGDFSSEDLEFLSLISKPLIYFIRDSIKIEELKKERKGEPEFEFMGKSRAVQKILELVERVKDNDTPVFITGESGTGKELIARAIHSRGKRVNSKFVAINCGAIPDHLLESELFGYVRGAFTGAWRSKIGLIEEAEGGTFLFDEIGDLSLRLQAKLLRMLEEKRIRRVGENETRAVNVRFMSATNKNIDKEVEKGNFRDDLYYRLKIITIEIPPLRERKEDLLFLIEHYLDTYCREMKKERSYFSPSALELMMNYSWPGNVRELQNEIQRCLILAGEESLIREQHLSSKINPRRSSPDESSYNFFQARAEFEKRFLNQALARFNYSRIKAAKEMGLSRQGLFKLMRKHKILPLQGEKRRKRKLENEP